MKLFLRYKFLVLVAALCLMIGCGGSMDVKEYEEQYLGRDVFFKEEEEDYFSYLLGFPEMEYKSMVVHEYQYDYLALPFDSEYFIYLEYELQEEEYFAEKERVKNLQMSYEGEIQQGIRLEDEVGEVYVLSWWEDRSYEYTVFDDDNYRIACVYTQLISPEVERIGGTYYVCEDVITMEVGNQFSMYYFDCGDGSYVLPELNGEGVKATVLY